MREIKFRGKRIDNGEWVFGYYVEIENYHYIVQVDSVVETTSSCARSLLKAVNNERFIEVDPETVGQYTGLHDKNGLTEIYEGDIIDIDGKLKGNIYESPQVYKEGTDIVIEKMGTRAWRGSESVAMGRGCKYSE